MPKIAKLWTLDGIANELATDPKTLSRKLSGLKPDDDSGRFSKYLMINVIRRLYADDVKSPSEAKARLDTLRADQVAIKLAIARKEAVPTVAVERAIGRMASMIASVLHSIPLQLKKANPSLSGASVEELRVVVTSVADEISKIRIDDSLEGDDDDDNAE